jgi:hypothetical protein
MTDGITDMKISARQVRAAVDSYVHGRAAQRLGRPAAARRLVGQLPPDDIRRQLDMLPDERDIVVHDLRSRVREGRYFVSSPEIVDALLGRLVANLIAE